MTRHSWIALLLALLTVGTFWQVRRNDFVNYDDPDYVTGNAIVQQGLTTRGLAWAFENVHGEKTYWHPLTWISHMLDCQWFGLNAGAHHLVNLFWHTANVVLLFAVLVQLTGRPWRSAMVAALFAVHPLQVDTVAWVTERKNLLSAFFFLATIGAYRNYALRPGPSRYAWVFVLFALGLMCKPAIVVLPCVLLLLDFWPLRRFESAPTPDATASGRHPLVSVRHLVLEKVPLLALSAASSYLTIQGHQGLGMIQSVQLSFVHRLENAIVSYARYLGKTLWPADLAVLYPHPGGWSRVAVIGSGLLLLLITDQVLRARQAKPYLLTGWLWFLGTLVPAIGLVQVGAQAIADRFVYLPLIGLFLLIVWSVADFAERFPRRTATLAGAGAAVLVACVAVTSVQLGYWRNSVTLFEHTARVTQDNYVAHHNLGAALLEKGDLAGAASQFQRVLQIRTNEQTLYEVGRVAEAQGKTNEAVTRYGQAAQMNPLWTLPRKRLALLIAQAGNTNAALNIYNELLRQAPADPEIQTEAAILLTHEDINQARMHYLEALKANPFYVPALNNLAWILATYPRVEVRSGPEAVQMAHRACELTQWKSPACIATLGAAAAETGNFDNAIRYVTQALSLLKAAGTNDTAEIEKMLGEFTAQPPQPHRAKF